jgi:hypothetical protein
MLLALLIGCLVNALTQLVLLYIIIDVIDLLLADASVVL